jgi:hypothetical protein
MKWFTVGILSIAICFLSVNAQAQVNTFIYSKHQTDFIISFENRDFTLGDTIKVDVAVRNKGKTSVYVIDHDKIVFQPSSGTLACELGSEWSYHPEYFSGSLIEVKRGQSKSYSVLLQLPTDSTSFGKNEVGSRVINFHAYEEPHMLGYIQFSGAIFFPSKDEKITFRTQMYEDKPILGFNSYTDGSLFDLRLTRFTIGIAEIRIVNSRD